MLLMLVGALLTAGSLPAAESPERHRPVSEHLDVTARTGRIGKSLIAGEQYRV